MRPSRTLLTALVITLAVLGISATPARAALSTRTQNYELLSFEGGVLRAKREIALTNPGTNYSIDISIGGTSSLEGVMTVQSTPAGLCAVQNTSQVRCTGTPSQISINWIEVYRPSIGADGTFTLRMDGAGSTVRDFLYRLINTIGLTIVSATEPPRSDNGTVLEWFKADTTQYVVTVTVRATTAPSPRAQVNFDTGKPGSFFTVSGTNFPLPGPITVSVNGTVIGTVTIAADGSFSFSLAIDNNTAAGWYRIQLVTGATQGSEADLTATGASVSQTIRVDPNAPLRTSDRPSDPQIALPTSVNPLTLIFTPTINR